MKETRKAIQRVDTLVVGGLNAVLFEQLRNLLNCALLFAAGSFVTSRSLNFSTTLLPSHTLGYITMAIAVGLWALNLYDGALKLRSRGMKPWLLTLVVVAYAILSWRILEVLLHFRGAA